MGLQTSGCEVACQGLVDPGYAVDSQIQTEPPNAKMLKYLHVRGVTKHTEF